MFSSEPAARAIIARHNALFRAKHGDAAADAEDAAHARLCARVREHNRKRGFTDAEIDDAYSAARARQEKRGKSPWNKGKRKAGATTASLL